MTAFKRVTPWQCAMCGQTWPPQINSDDRFEQRKVAEAKHPLQSCMPDSNSNREYASEVWEAEHPPADSDTLGPLEMLEAGMLNVQEFWATVCS